jgi:8-oxo-dGTP pyrophosphatase MutT (NUDIX family)
MHRNDLLEKLRAYADYWKEESETTGRFIQFVEKHPDCFERTLPIGHITGSAWLLHPAGTQVLLTHHKKLNIWVQLGGHADGNDDILKAALNEAIEESGIEEIVPLSRQIFDIDIHRIPERKNEPAHYHYDVRFAFKSLSEDYVVSEESHDLEWVNIGQLEKYTSEPSMLRMKAKWQRLMND